jgi:6-pyruvoyltetrahydropterin/6-carboxytetrahydropterin synthase
MSLFEITLGKENMKFSCAHFTLFDARVERLHGHNYRVWLTLAATRLRAGLLLDFGLVKEQARALCDAVDETLLLPGASPEVAIRATGQELEVRCRGKRYVLPAEDCRVLPIANVTCEALAEWFCSALVERLEPALREAGVVWLAATVEESPGQSGRHERSLTTAAR